ncbi:uncharacterized protein LOC141912640 [Tubulanus polymorphus]|uniref:uncharacterized protein LOC141901642 n=1 Tax=Tubulanus polymorphus TaxID=672921 RepID=UPI003DA2CBE8
MKIQFERQYNEGYDVAGDSLYEAWKSLKSNEINIHSNIFNNSSSPADSDKDVLKYPIVESRRSKNRTEDSKRYFILTADDAYAKALEKNRKKEEKENKKLERQERNKKCATSASSRPVESPVEEKKNENRVVEDPVSVPETSGVNLIHEINISEGSYVALYQEGQKGRKHLYFGVILEISNDGETMSVQFLEQYCNKNLFVWPDVELIEDHPVENIVNSLEPPEVVNTRIQMVFRAAEFVKSCDLFACICT